MSRAVPVLTTGRYAVYGPIAAGGMATVHFGRLIGPGGFSRTVAIKRLHPALATDPEFVATFMDEARLVSRVRHPNVVPVLDIVSDGGELLLAMEYVAGENLARLMRSAVRRQIRMPVPVAAAVVSGVLHGLHAAHEAKSESGRPLDLVHRDISPQNILVGADGGPHLVDFGIAKALGRSQTTREGKLKGKLPYMSPEQLRGEAVDRRTDIYATSVVLWELLAGERLFKGEEGAVFGRVQEGCKIPPSAKSPDIAAELDALTLRGLSLAPGDRFSTAREMALALESLVRLATPSEVGAWVEKVAGDVLTERAGQLAEIESSVNVTVPSTTPIRPERVSEPRLDTQASSISVSRPSKPLVSKSPSLLVSVALVLGVALSIGIWLAVRKKDADRPPDPIARKAAGEVTVEPLAEAPPAMEPPTIVTSADAAPPARPRENRAPAPAKSTPKKTGTATEEPASDPKCKYVGADGLWHVKPECL